MVFNKLTLRYKVYSTYVFVLYSLAMGCWAGEMTGFYVEGTAYLNKVCGDQLPFNGDSGVYFIFDVNL